jgi:hypothetical protein
MQIWLLQKAARLRVYCCMHSTPQTIFPILIYRWCIQIVLGSTCATTWCMFIPTCTYVVTCMVWCHVQTADNEFKTSVKSWLMYARHCQSPKINSEHDQSCIYPAVSKMVSTYWYCSLRYCNISLSPRGTCQKLWSILTNCSV